MEKQDMPKNSLSGQTASRPKVVQIKGANGSGKTTIARQLIAQSSDNHLLAGTSGATLATVLMDKHWCVLGKYAAGSKMGGCDGIDSVNGVKRAILACLNTYPTFNVLFEGMMISTIKSTFYDFLLRLEKARHIQPVFVILVTPADACIERLQARGTMKADLKRENIIHKCESVVAHAKTYADGYVRWMYPDSTPQPLMWDECERLVMRR